MTRKALHQTTSIRLNLTSASPPYLVELDEALVQAVRTAQAVARGRGKTADAFWMDEAKAEAYAIVTEIILTSFEETVEKYPDYEARFRFYRMSVGYGLKAYFAYRSLSTLGYLKSKGINPKHESFHDDYVARNDHTAVMNLALEWCAKTPMERLVLQFYLMGNEWDVISQKSGLPTKRVRKVMRRIKRRLKDDAGIKMKHGEIDDDVPAVC